MSPLAPVTRSLWERYRRTGDPVVRNELLSQHLGLVQHIARRAAVRIGRQVELDDLVSAGTLGLVLALESFDPERGLAFSTYATPRIRGAILDDLRARDCVSRSVRSKRRKISEAVHSLEMQLGRSPASLEIATTLDISLDTYWQWEQDGEGAVQVSYEAASSDDVGRSAGLDEMLADQSLHDPQETVAHEEEIAAVKDAMAELTPKERTVLGLYYYEELTLRQIAEILHLTESRISQIRSGALKRLRKNLNPKVET